MNTLSSISQKIIYYSFFALFFLTPFVFYPLTKYFPFPWFIFNVDPFTYELFEYNKMFFVYGLTIIILSAWTVRSIAEKRIVFQRTFPDYALALFLLSQILSTIFSIDVHTSVWGYYSRFHGGLVSTICYTGLYWAFVSNLLDRRYVRTLMRAALISATLVSWYGIAQHLGVDADYWVQNVRARVFSSLGQPNWLAAYLVALIPVGISFFLYEKKFVWKTFYLICVCSLFLSFLYTASRSGLLALVTSLMIFTILIFGKRVNEIRTGSRYLLGPLALGIATIFAYIFGYYKYPAHALNLSLIMIGISFAGILYFYNSYQRVWIGVLGSLIILMGILNFSPDAFRLGQPTALNNQNSQTIPQEAGGTETGRIRFIVWKGAWEIFKKNPVLGSGVESFAYSFYQNRPLELLHTTEWDFLYNKAHNEYFNFLATTGLFGTGIYIFFILHVLYFGYISYSNLPSFTTAQASENLIQLKSKKKKSESTEDVDYNNLILLVESGVLSGFITILITNFFGFSVVNVALLFFLFPAFMAGILTHKRQSFIYRLLLSRIKLFEWHWKQDHSTARTILSCAVVVVSLYLISSLFSFWFADIAFANGRSLNRQAQIGQAHQKFLQAVALRQDEPFYYSELGWTQGNMVYALMNQHDSSHAAELAPLAEQNAHKAVDISPNNVNYWKKLADTYYNLSYFDTEQYREKLLQASDRTQTLAPTDVSTLLTLSVYYERAGKIDEAYRIVEQSTKWKNDLGEAWYRLGELAYHKYKISHDEREKIVSEEYRYKASQLDSKNEDFKKAYE